MGHYRSEMGYEAEDERKAAVKKVRLKNMTINIQKEIDDRGVAAVLASILEDKYYYMRFDRVPT